MQVTVVLKCVKEISKSQVLGSYYNILYALRNIYYAGLPLIHYILLTYF